MHILIYITLEEGCGKGFPQHQRTWKILRCINDCLFSPAKNQTEISSRTHREWGWAGRSDRFQHHTQSAIVYYWIWICHSMTFFFSYALLSLPTFQYMCTDINISQLVGFEKHLLRKPWHTSGLLGLVLNHFCHHTIIYAATQLRTICRSIRNVCIFTLPGISSTKPNNLPRPH